MIFRVNSSSDSRSSSSSQSNQESSLSWHHALLFPFWVRPISSPPSSIGTPCERNSVVRKLRRCRVAQRVDLLIVGVALGAAVPAAVVVGPVAVALAVRLVVLLVVGDEIPEREPVVRGDEVDRRERRAAVVLVEVARPGRARREVGDAGAPAPEVPHRVAVEAVPLRPEHREVADLVAARADVPGLGDQLDLREHRVLVDDVEERGEAVDVVELARERRGQVEAEPVDVTLHGEVAQRVHDQPQHARVHRVEAVAGPGEVHVEAALVGDQPVVRRVVDALERQHRPEVVALGRVVVDDVEDHLDAGRVQGLHHALELEHLLARSCRSPRRGRADARKPIEL